VTRFSSMLCKADAWPIAGRAFPDYKGKQFSMRVTSSLTVFDLNWGDGTRNVYKAVELAEDGVVNSAQVPAPWMHQEVGRTLAIPPGWAVVEHSVFCGKDMGLTLYIHPNDAAKHLPAPADDYKE